MLEIDQDSDCVMGSLVRAMNESETWLRPLSDGSFGVVLLNKGDHSTNITLFVANVADTQWGDFYPVTFSADDHFAVRDV
eukprot:COSAG06_NODE_45223_length_356_cov_1.206226_1_plen_79_part_01